MLCILCLRVTTHHEAGISNPWVMNFKILVEPSTFNITMHPVCVQDVQSWRRFNAFSQSDLFPWSLNLVQEKWVFIILACSISLHISSWFNFEKFPPPRFKSLHSHSTILITHPEPQISHFYVKASMLAQHSYPSTSSLLPHPRVWNSHPRWQMTPCSI